MTKDQRAAQRRADKRARRATRLMRGRSDVRARGSRMRRRGVKEPVERLWRRAFEGILTVAALKRLNAGNDPGRLTRRRQVAAAQRRSGAVKRRDRATALGSVCQARVTVPATGALSYNVDGGTLMTSRIESASFTCGLPLRSRHGDLSCPVHGGAWWA